MIDKTLIEDLAADLSGSEAAYFKEQAARAESPTGRMELIAASRATPGKIQNKLATLAHALNTQADEAAEAPRRQAEAEARVAAAAQWRTDDLALRQRRRDLAARATDQSASPTAREAAQAELQNLPREVRYTPPPPPQTA